MEKPNVSRLGTVEFTGEIYKDKDVSAIDRSGNFLIIGADESSQVQVLKHQGNHYEVIKNITAVFG